MPPVTSVQLGQAGRVEILKATIEKCHLKELGKPRRRISKIVRRFVESLGQVKGGVKGIRDSDEVGHIIADCLGGPNDFLHNFFPQSPQCNLEYYKKVEKAIYDYLIAQNSTDAYVEVKVELNYNHDKYGLSPNRPIEIWVWIKFSNGKIVELMIRNT